MSRDTIISELIRNRDVPECYRLFVGVKIAVVWKPRGEPGDDAGPGYNAPWVDVNRIKRNPGFAWWPWLAVGNVSGRSRAGFLLPCLNLAYQRPSI